MKAELICNSGDDLLVVNAARCSFGKEKTDFDEKDAKLIHYLAREKHVLPFRHPSITLRCKAPIFLARQLGKHQVGMSWSEESRRYIDNEPEFFWPDKWRKRADNVKQGSSDESVYTIRDFATGEPYVTQEAAEDILWHNVKLYEAMLEGDVAPELARMILPQNMYVTWVWTGTLLSWTHMVKLRKEEHAQREAQDFAAIVENIISPLYPVSWQALMENQ